MSICVFILLPSVCFRCYIYNMCILHCVHVNNSPHPSLSFPRACALEITYGMCSPEGDVLLGTHICSPWGCPHGCMLGSPARARHLRVSSLEVTCNVACGVRACALASTYGICSLRRVSSRVHIHVHRLRVSSRGCMWGLVEYIRCTYMYRGIYFVYYIVCM